MNQKALQKHIWYVLAALFMNSSIYATEEVGAAGLSANGAGKADCSSVITQGASCHLSVMDTPSLRDIGVGLDAALIKQQDTQAIQNTLIGILNQYPDTLDGVLKFLKRNPQYKNNPGLQQNILDQVEKHLLQETSDATPSGGTKKQQQWTPQQAFEWIALIGELGYLDGPEGTKRISKWLGESKNAHLTQAIVQAAPEQSIHFIQKSMTPKTKEQVRHTGRKSFLRIRHK